MQWIHLDIVDNQILPIANKLMNKNLREQGYEIEENPHVTIIPKFESSENIDLPILRPNQMFKVSGFKFWPDIEDPMIVMLDVSDDMIIQLWRNEIITQIGEDAVKKELVPPHITLFKAGNVGDEFDFRLDSEIRNNLLNACDSLDVEGHVQANSINIDDWEDGL